MKILFWSEYFLPNIGGVEVFSAHLVSALRALGHEIVIVSSRRDLKHPDEIRHGDVPVFRFPFQALLTSQNYRQILSARERIAELRRMFQPDVVHLNTVGPSLFFYAHTTSAFPAPTVVTIHGLPDRFAPQFSLLQRVLTSARWVVAVSRAMLDDTRAIEPTINSRSSIIYNSLQISTITPLPLDFDAPRVLGLGRLIREKGFDLAIRAFPHVLDRFPAAQLCIAGEGPEKLSLAALAREAGIERAVKFTGRIEPDDVPALINESSLVVMPSWYEPFGLVALQAAQMGRPVVATRLRGLDEVVLEGKTGLLFDPRNSTALAEALEWLLAHPAEAQRMGQAARRHARGTFQWKRHVAAYDALYQRLHKRARRA